MNLEQDVIAKVSTVGELLIRAAAILGSLSVDQQNDLRNATDGSLPDCLMLALRACEEVSDEVKQSMQTHPPTGLVVVGRKPIQAVMMTGQSHPTREDAEDTMAGTKAIPGFIAGYIDSKEYRVVSFHEDSHPKLPLGRGQQRVELTLAD